MAKAKQPVLESKYGQVENIIKHQCIDSEYRTAASNNTQQVSDYESILDMLDLVRAEKNYSWQSDIFIGLLPSHMLTEQATWAAQDFLSRDFVDIYLEGNHDDDKLKAQAAKTLLNCLLNIKDIYHFHKRMRARTINWLFGQVYAVMWWEKEVATKKRPRPPLQSVINDYDDEGNLVPKMVSIPQEDEEYKEIITDRMNYEVFDSRNVFTDFTYTYSAQQKQWITLRSEKTISEVLADADKFDYFNLDVLKQRIFSSKTNKGRKQGSSPETDTSKESYNKLGGAYGTKQGSSNIDPALDILDRYGKIWAVVTEKDEEGLPTKIEPGYTDSGELKDGAELVEAIVTHAGIGGDFTLIGFRPTWAYDAYGKPFKPIIRGWCYLHPTKDIGLSDGKNLREMNIAVNDTFNLGNDRDMLATLPVLKGRRDAIENNPTAFIEPENIILLENVETDLQELTIRPNNGSNMQQLGFLKSTASEMDAIWPTTMGGLPEKTSTTATAVAGAETRTSARGNLKGITWDYTFDIEFYPMILNLVYRNMEQETLNKILGEEMAQHFDPKSDYTFVSLSENLEQEHTKQKKIANYDQVLGRLSGIGKVLPDILPPVTAHIFSKICQLLGSEYREIAEIVEKIMNAKVQEKGKGVEQVKDGKPPAVSNQHGIEQSSIEQMTRGNQ